MLEYTNPFALDPDEEGTCYAEWCLNDSFKNFSGIIVRGLSEAMKINIDNPLSNLPKYATLSTKVHSGGIHESKGIVWHGSYPSEHRILRH